MNGLMSSQIDSVVRAMTDDGSFRVITTRTTDTVRGVLASQSARGEQARWLADLVTGTILVRETMAPSLRVQGIVQGIGGRGSLVADAHPDGSTRGLLQQPRGTEIRLGGGALLQMMRTMPSGALHKGVVEVPEDTGISGALMAYMQTSEQVLSMIAVGTVFHGDEVVSAGGYIVQLLPELGEAQLAIMTERLHDFPSIESMLDSPDFTPDTLLAELLYRMPHSRLAESAVGFQCQCSEVRVLTSLATLPRVEIEEMLADARPLEITCDYCQREYRIEPAQLRGLLAQS